jgi:hypothetical protein
MNLQFRMVSSGMLRRVARVRTGVLEERSASIIRVTRIGEMGTTLAATSNYHCAMKTFGGVDIYRLRFT